MNGLQLDRVTVRFGEVTAVDEVSLAVPSGRVLAVLGPSGCGKSTLLRAIAGLEPVTAGTISYDGTSLAGVPTHRRGFALMFQDGQLFDHLSVAENVGYALRIRGRRDPARITELLELVDLPGYDARRPATLSGGERQRVALARALAVEPRLLLLDEPLSALDATLRERVAQDLRGILTRTSSTALLVTHDHDEAFAVADDLAVMRAGRVVQTGPISEVWAAPVDAETALLLGYARVLPGQVIGLEGTVAMRRSALRVDPAGTLPARVVSVRSTPEQWRLQVTAEDGTELDAVADLDRPVAVGESVRLLLDRSRVAPVGNGAVGGSP